MASTTIDDKPLHLVLVGGGHAHLQVIQAMKHQSQDQVKVTLVDGQSQASYSGMVPGAIANLYPNVETTQIDLAALAKASNIHFVPATVTRVNVQDKTITTCASGHDGGTNSNSPNTKQTTIPFDVLSLDVGSASRDWHVIPGAQEYTIPTRPIAALVQRLQHARQQALLQKQQQQKQSFDQKPVRIIVVGAGVAGVELALALASRWSLDGLDPHVTLVSSSPTLWPHESTIVQAKLHDLFAHNNITLQPHCRVTQVLLNKLLLQQQQQNEPGNANNTNEEPEPPSSLELPFDHCIWATGAGPQELVRTNFMSSPNQPPQGPSTTNTDNPPWLKVTPEGWIAVHPTLQSISHPFVFAAGDCATIVPPNSKKHNNSNDNDDEKSSVVTGRAWPPKAGVYAVRAGPILGQNLTRYLDRLRFFAKNQSSSNYQPIELVEYQPQTDFFRLLVCDARPPGKALGLRFGIYVYGAWVFAMKDRIDSNFMRLFQMTQDKHQDPTSNAIDSSSSSSSSSSIYSVPYQTQQYDAQDDVTDYLENRRKQHPRIGNDPLEDPYQAAVLIRRQDDNVDFVQAWSVLRIMAEQPTFRQEVLDQWWKLEWASTNKTIESHQLSEAGEHET